MRFPRLSAFLYTAIVLIGLLLALPNLFSKEFMQKYLPFLPDTRVTLGLDLKGGSYLVLEIDKAALIKEKLQNKLENISQQLNDKKLQINTIKANNNAITITAKNPKDLNAIATALKNINAIKIASQAEQLNITLADDELNTQLKQAIEQSVEIIRKRIDEVGVAEPSIQKIGSDRVMVQLPGMQQPGQLRALLGKTAKLSFHLVDIVWRLTQARGW